MLVIWAWTFNSINVVIALGVWEGVWLFAFFCVKILMPKLQKNALDKQTRTVFCSEVGRLSDVNKITENYVIFANYVYDTRGF